MASIVDSHHPMTGKHLPRRAVERCCGEPCIDRGVLDIGVSQPVLHKRKIGTGIKQVCRDGVLQATELPFLYRQPCKLSIRLHKVVQHISADGYPAVGEKEVWRFIRTCPEIGTYRLQYVRLHGVHAGDRPLKPVNANSPLLGIYIGAL